MTRTRSPVRLPAGRPRPATPRFATRRRPERPTRGGEIAKAAAWLGMPLLPWQREWVDVFGEFDPETGVPFYSVGMFTTPRQQGKTVVLLSTGAERCVSGKQRRVAWSAQTGKDGREKWNDELYGILEDEDRPMSHLVQSCGRGVGNEVIKFRNGSLIRLVAKSESSGHGKTLHLSLEDEIFADTTAWRAQAFGPAMLTVADSQRLICSTAGTQASVVYNSLRREGRTAVEADTGEGMCYLEYSAELDWDFMDEDTWWDHMPSLGYTVTVKSMRAAIMDMLNDPEGGVDGVKRAYGNITAGAGAGMVTEEMWSACASMASPSGQLGFGLAVSRDKSWSCVVAADRSGAVEVVRYAAGTGWVVDEVNRLCAEHRARVALDMGGPAGALADSLTAVERASGRDVFSACENFYEGIRAGTVYVRPSEPLTKAALGAAKKQVGDRWCWHRELSKSDVSPLEAASLAAWVATHTKTVDLLEQVW